MILDKEIEIKISNNQIKWYKNKGYDFKGGNEIKTIKIEDLPKNSGQKIKVKCDICGLEKSISLNRYHTNTKNNKTYYSCSRKCSELKNKETLKEKYNIDNISKLKEIKEKKEETCLKNFNVKYPQQNEIIFFKSKNTKLQKYNNSNYNNIEKRKQTCIKKYNIDVASKSEIVKNKLRKSQFTKDYILKKCKEIHHNEYEYLEFDYKNVRSYLNIRCKKHGDFKQMIYKHLQNQGCPYCKESKGEKKIRIFLEKNNIKFEQQKKFKNCKNINLLPFDFFLPEYNLCIEYDGIQHFEIIEFFGGLEEFNKRIKNDNIKNDFCKQNNINLIRISYKDNFKLENIFKQKL